MEKNRKLFKISADLDDKKKEDRPIFSHRKASELGALAKKQLNEALAVNNLESPLKNTLNKILEIVEPAVEFAERYSASMSSPPKNTKKPKNSGPARNTIDEFQASAKWATDNDRRDKLRELSGRLSERKEAKDTARRAEEMRRQQTKQIADDRNKENDKVRQLLVFHQALLPDHPLDKKTLVTFYLDNKEDIDNILGHSIPPSKRSKTNLMAIILNHFNEFMDM